MLPLTIFYSVQKSKNSIQSCHIYIYINYKSVFLYAVFLCCICLHVATLYRLHAIFYSLHVSYMFTYVMMIMYAYRCKYKDNSKKISIYKNCETYIN